MKSCDNKSSNSTKNKTKAKDIAFIEDNNQYFVWFHPIVKTSAIITEMMATLASSSSVSLSSTCSLSTINDIAAELITSNSATNGPIGGSQVSSLPQNNGPNSSPHNEPNHHSVAHRQSLTSSSPPLIASTLSKCPLCSEAYVQPKVMACCFATFCQTCLEKILDSPDRIKCPGCGHESLLPSNGVAGKSLSSLLFVVSVTFVVLNVKMCVNCRAIGLLSDYATVNMLEQIAVLDASISSNASISCTGCKSKELAAVARCFDCANFLCPNCVMAHQFMHCFEGHRVMTLGEPQQKDIPNHQRPVVCCKHSEEMKYYCRSCDVPLCKECCVFDHPKGLHDHEYLADAAPKQVCHCLMSSLMLAISLFCYEYNYSLFCAKCYPKSMETNIFSLFVWKCYSFWVFNWISIRFIHLS